jgi:hypothetical protein
MLLARMGIRASGATFEVARTIAKGSHAKTRTGNGEKKIQLKKNCNFFEIFFFFPFSFLGCRSVVLFIA